MVMKAITVLTNYCTDQLLIHRSIAVIVNKELTSRIPSLLNMKTNNGIQRNLELNCKDTLSWEWGANLKKTDFASDAPPSMLDCQNCLMVREKIPVRLPDLSKLYIKMVAILLLLAFYTHSRDKLIVLLNSACLVNTKCIILVYKQYYGLRYMYILLDGYCYFTYKNGRHLEFQSFIYMLEKR